MAFCGPNELQPCYDDNNHSNDNDNNYNHEVNRKVVCWKKAEKVITRAERKEELEKTLRIEAQEELVELELKANAINSTSTGTSTSPKSSSSPSSSSSSKPKSRSGRGRGKKRTKDSVDMGEKEEKEDKEEKEGESSPKKDKNIKSKKDILADFINKKWKPLPPVQKVTNKVLSMDVKRMAALNTHIHYESLRTGQELIAKGCTYNHQAPLTLIHTFGGMGSTKTASASANGTENEEKEKEKQDIPRDLVTLATLKSMLRCWEKGWDRMFLSAGTHKELITKLYHCMSFYARAIGILRIGQGDVHGPSQGGGDGQGEIDNADADNVIGTEMKSADKGKGKGKGKSSRKISRVVQGTWAGGCTHQMEADVIPRSEGTFL